MQRFYISLVYPKRLDVPGRKRLEVDYGKPIREIIA